jgi:hypothetical protein
MNQRDGRRAWKLSRGLVWISVIRVRHFTITPLYREPVSQIGRERVYPEVMSTFGADLRNATGQNMKWLVLVAIIVVSARAQAPDPQVLHIGALRGDQQRKALRAVLIAPITHAGFYDTVFYCEAELRDSLRRLVSDRKTGIEAAYFLSLVADANDLRAIIRKPPRSKLISDRWAYRIASSLLEAKEEEDWKFLRDCLMGKYHARGQLPGQCRHLS